MPILGRAREVAEVSALVGKHQVVTIAGAGGIGKTRLAVEVAAAAGGAERDGVAFVDFSPITDSQLLAVTIASAVDVDILPSHEPTDSLVAALRERPMLLVLDNCEHVVTGVAQLVEALVSACRGVRIIATTREPLGIEGEAVYRLGTLDERSAMELFAAHAYQADPNFSPSGRNMPVLRDICKRLDGIALAIVLAAANVRVMPLGQLRARLDGKFRLLVAGSRAVMLPRHQTMQALIDWSYDLLTDAERKIFRRLGVFGGSFSREAALSIAGREADEASPVGDCIDALVAKSMVVTDAEQSERYRMLESIRQYAVEHLREAGEEREARRSFANYFAERSADAAATFGEDSEESWLARYAPDLDNFRAALEWARDIDVELAAYIAANLADSWEFNNLFDEGLRRSEAILAALPHPGEPNATPLLLAVARLGLASGIYRRSLEVAERAAAERSRDLRTLAESRRIAGRSRYLLGIDPQHSLWDLHDALEVIRRFEKPFYVARALRDYASALAQTEPEEGRQLLLEALELARSLAWPRLTVHVEINVAEREFRSGDVPSAVERARDVIALLRGRRSPLQLAHALTNLASYLTINGQLDEALDAAREAVSIGRSLDSQTYIVLPMQTVAIVAANAGEAQRAARLLGFVDAFYDRYRMKREATEAMVHRQLLDALDGTLDEANLEKAIAAGRMLADEEAWTLAFLPQEPTLQGAV